MWLLIFLGSVTQLTVVVQLSFSQLLKQQHNNDIINDVLQTCPHKLFWRCVPGHCDSIDELTVYNQKATEFYNCNYLLNNPYSVKLWITHDVTLYRDFYRRILSSTVNWTKTWNFFVFKIPDNFWCRNLSNCLLKAIDKASDILMFDLPPNLQNCSLLETLYRIGLSFSLYILRFFFFYFFLLLLSYM